MPMILSLLVLRKKYWKIKSDLQWKSFLGIRGLELSEEKTSITHIQEGFDFLGFNIRKYNNKLLIKPAKKNVLEFVEAAKEVIRKGRGMNAEYLIYQLNPKLIGWANYYRGSVAKKVFSYVDYQIYKELWKWTKRRHANKSKQWLVKKYYRVRAGNVWIFKATSKTSKGEIKPIELAKISTISIRRHIKVRSEANPYDPKYAEYYESRKRRVKEKKTDQTVPTF